MNRPTTRTEQMLDSASKGVSSRLVLAEAARFVEPGEIFVVGLIQRLLRKPASLRAFAAITLRRMISCTVDYRRVCVATGVYQLPCNAESSGWSGVRAGCERVVGHSEVCCFFALDTSELTVIRSDWLDAPFDSPNDQGGYADTPQLLHD